MSSDAENPVMPPALHGPVHFWSRVPLAVDEDSLPGLLEAAGLRLEDMEIRLGPLEDPPARAGYDGMVFACGRLAAA